MIKKIYDAKLTECTNIDIIENMPLLSKSSLMFSSNSLDNKLKQLNDINNHIKNKRILSIKLEYDNTINDYNLIFSIDDYYNFISPINISTIKINNIKNIKLIDNLLKFLDDMLIIGIDRFNEINKINNKALKYSIYQENKLYKKVMNKCNFKYIFEDREVELNILFDYKFNIMINIKNNNIFNELKLCSEIKSPGNEYFTYYLEKYYKIYLIIEKINELISKGV